MLLYAVAALKEDRYLLNILLGVCKKAQGSGTNQMHQHSMIGRRLKHVMEDEEQRGAVSTQMGEMDCLYSRRQDEDFTTNAKIKRALYAIVTTKASLFLNSVFV